MKRREALRISGISLGFGISGIGMSSLISSCKQDVASGKSISFLDESQLKFVSTLADVILPATANGPAAIEVKTAEFINHFIDKVYNEEAKSRFSKELEQLIAQCKTLSGKPMNELDDAQKKDFVGKLESDGYVPAKSIWGNPVEDGSPLPFYKELKSLIMMAYFGSEKVGKEVLVYAQLAPNFLGCVDVTSETRLRSI